MDKSLKVRLLRNLMLSLTLAWLATLIVGYAFTQRTLNQQLDSQLEQIADSLSDVQITNTTSVEIHQTETYTERGVKSVEFQIWRNDKMVGYSAHAPRGVLSQGEGYSQNEVDNKRWRVFSARNANNAQIMVGEDLDVRRSLIRGMILSSLWPMLVALPIIALILWISVTVGLKPLSALAREIKERSPEQLTKIDLGDVPSEVTPVVQSLNNLLEVVDKALEREKHFTDNAAHELRTPLAAIKTQAQLALRSKDEKEKNDGLEAVNHGIDRASRMVTQLLTMARLDPESLKITFSAVGLNSLVTDVIAKLTPLALMKDIDIGFSESDQVSVKGEATYLELMIANLVDNAIRYSPVGGVIDLQIRRNGPQAVLTITDNGPGIPAADREKVFDRFVRLGGGDTEGSGIGLSIVKKIIALHHAEIELSAPAAHHGLVVKVIFQALIT